MKNRILIIFTGGTIGATSSKGIINVDSNKPYQLIEAFRDSSSPYSQVDFITKEPLNILSENCTPDDWTTMANAILEEDLTKYDGIILTHGTDTLPYTSSALSFCLNHITIPIVIVASDKPLDDMNSNGLFNFTYAVKFIIEEQIPGVFVIYRNPCNEGYLHLGSRLITAMPFMHSFKSEKNAYLAKVFDNMFEFNDSNLSPPKEALCAGKQNEVTIKPMFDSDILYIAQYPGFNYNLIDLSIKPRAVLHGLYHSGTACTGSSDEKNNVLSFASKCKDLGIDLYMAPIASEGDIYDTATDILKAGVIPLHNISVEAALVKIMLCYGNRKNISDIQSFVKSKEISYEFIQERT